MVYSAVLLWYGQHYFLAQTGKQGKTTLKKGLEIAITDRTRQKKFLFTFPLAALEIQTEHFYKNNHVRAVCDVLDKHIEKDFWEQDEKNYLDKKIHWKLL